MTDLIAFINENLTKSHFGIPAVLSRSKDEIVTDNYFLRDLSIGIITLYLNGDSEKALTLYNEKFSFYRDMDFHGYYEQIDISGSINALSLIRTPKNQALALLAEFISEVKISNKQGPESYLQKIIEIITLMEEKKWPNVFDRSFEIAIDDSQKLDTVSILSLTYSFITQHSSAKGRSEDINIQRLLSSKLNEFITHSGAIAALSAGGHPDQRYGYHLHASALAALAWTWLYKAGNHLGLDNASHIFSHIRKSHMHEYNHGFWNRVNYQNVVEVDPVSYVYGHTDSPFPIKNMRDHAILKIAADEFLKLQQNADVEELQLKAANELVRYADKEIGGIFHGQGSWFSTPHDATVPLARHVMVKQNTKGSFSVGNTSYVPFNEKHADTQFLSLLALGKGENNASEPSDNNKPKHILAKSLVPTQLTPPTDSKLSDGIINIDKYVAWLKSTTAGYGYGLTPYRSPLGLRSDKTPQIFSALHVVSDFAVLGIKPENEDALISGLSSAQNTDGGFSEQAGLLSEVFTTYCAVLTSVILGRLEFNKQAAINFTLDCQHQEGGFGNSPGYPCDVWHTNLAVLSLVALGVRPRYENKLINYLVECQNQDGGYSNQPYLKSDVFATFRAVSTLLSLGFIPPNHHKTVKWLQQLQTESGGFRYKENAAESFVGGYHAIAALYILGSSPENTDACINYISVRQNADGGFARKPNHPSETTDEGFIAIQALHMLEGKLNPYWAIIIT